MANSKSNELDLVKKLLFGAYLRTLDVVNLDKDTLEKGDDPETAFETQWNFIKPHLNKIVQQTALEAQEQLLDRLIEQASENYIEGEERVMGYVPVDILTTEKARLKK